MMQQVRSGKKSVGVKMRMQVISVKVAELQNRWPGCQEIQYSFTQIHSSGSALTEFAHILFRKVGKIQKARNEMGDIFPDRFHILNGQKTQTLAAEILCPKMQFW